MLTLRRLLEMSLPEVAVRARQHAGMRAERLFPPGRHRSGHLVPVERIGGRLPGGAADPELASLLKRRCPDHVSRLRLAADRRLRGEFDLLGYEGLRFGDPIDWHLDPVAGRRSPRLHWSRIDPLDARVVGDSKVVWELNRHQWLLTLAQAFRLGGDERDAEACARQLLAWRPENPRGLGINWASSLEVSLRLISWCWVLALLEAGDGLRPELAAEALDGLAEHAAHVARYLSLYFSPNTHLTGEALGLVYAGSVLAGHREARAWRERGLEILLRESERQVLADGVYFEHAACYQRYTVEILLQLQMLAGPAGIRLPERVALVTQRLLDFLLATRRGDGGMPAIGDADGGWLLPLVRREPDDLRGVFGVAAAVFARRDYALAAGGLQPEVVWLLGARGVAAFDALEPRRPESDASRLFDAGGYAVMAGGWGRRAHRLVLDLGPLGCPVGAGHGHASLLAIDCSVFGQACVVDPGTYAYTPEPVWRDHFRSARAHSAPTVDGREPALPSGPFAWSSRPGARLRHWLSTSRFDYADADHGAFGRAGAPLEVRRRVLFAKPSCFVVLDEASGGGEHLLEVRFQFAPLRVRPGRNGWLLVELAEGRGLAVRCFASAPLTVSVHSGETAPIRGWVSPDYGRRVEAPLLRLAARGSLPLRTLTLLVPLPDVGAAPPEIEPVSREGRAVSGVRFPASGELVWFGAHEVVFECAASSESSR